MQQGRHIAHKFESGWEVGVIKAFDKVKYSRHIAHKFESGWEVGVIKAFDKVKYSQG